MEGVRATLTSVAAVTPRELVLPVTPWRDAEIITLPTERPETMPRFVTAATAELLLFHEACVVRSC
jgi:hypothetical protein